MTEAFVSKNFELALNESVEMRSGAVCNQSFIDFVNACKAAYDRTYQNSYNDSFQNSYQQTYQPAFKTNYKLAFDKNKAVRYQEGYQAVYTTAFNQGVVAGSKEAQNKGITDGQLAGFQQNIVQARQLAYAKGAAITDDFFSKNAVLKVQDVGFTRIGLDGSVGGSVGVSDIIKLNINIANFGLVASDLNTAKVEIESLSSNLLIEKSITQLASIPAQSLATVKNVLTAKITQGAAAGSTEKLKVKITTADGKTDERLITIQVIANLQVKFTNINFNASPRIGRTQYMKVTLNNVGTIEPSQKVTLTLTSEAAASDLRIDVSEVEVYRLPVGTIFVIPGLAYTVLNQQALAKGIIMHVSLKHGTRVVLTQDIKLQ